MCLTYHIVWLGCGHSTAYDFNDCFNGNRKLITGCPIGIEQHKYDPRQGNCPVCIGERVERLDAFRGASLALAASQTQRPDVLNVAAVGERRLVNENAGANPRIAGETQSGGGLQEVDKNTGEPAAAKQNAGDEQKGGNGQA